jgi:TolB-like protein
MRNETPRRRVGRQGTVTLFALLASAAPHARAYQQEAKAVAAQVAEILARGERKRVAVVDFTDLQGTASELGRFLAEEVSVALALSAPTLEVIDRTHLKAIVQEHKLSASGLIDPLTARKLGQIAGVEALVTGTITPFGDSIRLAAKVLDTSTARMLAASTVDIPRTKTTDELVSRGVGTVGPSGGVAPTPAPRPAGAVTARLGSVEIAIRECSRQGAEVVCKGSLVNRGTQQQTLKFSYSVGTATDDGGDQAPWMRLTFGPGGSYLAQDLEPEVPVNFSLTMPLSANAGALTLAVYVSVGSSDFSKVILRSVPIR